MTPKEILQKWIDCFNAADAVALANLYAQDAINHQVANTPVIGKTAIHEMNLQPQKWFVLLSIYSRMENGLSWNGKIRSGCEDADSFMCKTIK